MSAAEVLPIRSRRFERALRVQTVQHLFAAVLLITTALTHLTDPKNHHYVLPVLELVTGAVLIGMAIYEKVRKRHTKMGWVELAGAAMTFVEAIAKLNEPHRPLFYVLSFVPPVMLLVLGLFHEQIRRRPSLKVDDEGFEMRLRVLFKRRVPWSGVSSYRITPTHVEFAREDGSTKRLRITDIVEREQAVRWMEEQFAKRGLRAAAPGSAPLDELPGGERGADQGQDDQQLVPADRGPD